jgi:abortive infection bacteriophage resistance protein
MVKKTAKNIEEQITLLKSQGMTFNNDNYAEKIFSRISYYRLEGYWWDMQIDTSQHVFGQDACFKNVVNRYEFDKQLKIILFKAIESIEISLRTKMIYNLSLSYGPLWYLNSNLFDDVVKHSQHSQKLLQDFSYSKEVFAQDHKQRFSGQDPEAWKIMEVASMGLLSKYYKNLKHQLPEKTRIANDFGLTQRELSSWLEAIVYVRNIIAHHARLWSRTMSKRPKRNLRHSNNPWLNNEMFRTSNGKLSAQEKKLFLIISTMVYLCNRLDDYKLKKEIIKLFKKNKQVPIYKLGFVDGWRKHPLWRRSFIIFD